MVTLNDFTYPFFWSLYVDLITLVFLPSDSYNKFSIVIKEIKFITKKFFLIDEEPVMGKKSAKPCLNLSLSLPLPPLFNKSIAF